MESVISESESEFEDFEDAEWFDWLGCSVDSTLDASTVLLKLSPPSTTTNSPSASCFSLSTTYKREWTQFFNPGPASKRLFSLSTMFSVNQGLRVPTLSDIHYYWSNDPQAKRIMGRFCDMPPRTPEDLNPATKAEDQWQQDSDHHHDYIHCPDDRFMDPGNAVLFNVPEVLKDLQPRHNHRDNSVIAEILIESFFPEKLEKCNFITGVKGIDYIEDFEENRRALLRDVARKLHLTPQNLFRFCKEHKEAGDWIKYVLSFQPKIDRLLAKIYVDLRTWTMIMVAETQEQFDKIELIALLNTLFPPGPYDLPARVNREALAKHRNAFFQLIRKLESEPCQESRQSLIQQRISHMNHDGFTNNWAKTHETLWDYLTLGEKMRKDSELIMSRGLGAFPSDQSRPTKVEYNPAGDCFDEVETTEASHIGGSLLESESPKPPVSPGAAVQPSTPPGLQGASSSAADVLALPAEQHSSGSAEIPPPIPARHPLRHRRSKLPTPLNSNTSNQSGSSSLPAPALQTASGILKPTQPPNQQNPNYIKPDAASVNSLSRRQFGVPPSAGVTPPIAVQGRQEKRVSRIEEGSEPPTPKNSPKVRDVGRHLQKPPGIPINNQSPQRFLDNANVQRHREQDSKGSFQSVDTDTVFGLRDSNTPLRLSPDIPISPTAPVEPLREYKITPAEEQLREKLRNREEIRSHLGKSSTPAISQPMIVAEDRNRENSRRHFGNSSIPVISHPMIDAEDLEPLLPPPTDVFARYSDSNTNSNPELRRKSSAQRLKHSLSRPSLSSISSMFKRKRDESSVSQGPDDDMPPLPKRKFINPLRKGLNLLKKSKTEANLLTKSETEANFKTPASFGFGKSRLPKLRKSFAALTTSRSKRRLSQHYDDEDDIAKSIRDSGVVRAVDGMHLPNEADENFSDDGYRDFDDTFLDTSVSPSPPNIEEDSTQLANDQSQKATNVSLDVAPSVPSPATVLSPSMASPKPYGPQGLPMTSSVFKTVEDKVKDIDQPKLGENVKGKNSEIFLETVFRALDPTVIKCPTPSPDKHTLLDAINGKEDQSVGEIGGSDSGAPPSLRSLLSPLGDIDEPSFDPVAETEGDLADEDVPPTLYDGFENKDKPRQITHGEALRSLAEMRRKEKKPRQAEAPKKPKRNPKQTKEGAPDGLYLHPERPEYHQMEYTRQWYIAYARWKADPRGNPEPPGKPNPYMSLVGIPKHSRKAPGPSSPSNSTPYLPQTHGGFDASTTSFRTGSPSTILEENYRVDSPFVRSGTAMSERSYQEERARSPYSRSGTAMSDRSYQDERAGSPFLRSGTAMSNRSLLSPFQRSTTAMSGRSLIKAPKFMGKLFSSPSLQSLRSARGFGEGEVLGKESQPLLDVNGKAVFRHENQVGIPIPLPLGSKHVHPPMPLPPPPPMPLPVYALPKRKTQSDAGLVPYSKSKLDKTKAVAAALTGNVVENALGIVLEPVFSPKTSPPNPDHRRKSSSSPVDTATPSKPSPVSEAINSDLRETVEEENHTSRAGSPVELPSASHSTPSPAESVVDLLEGQDAVDLAKIPGAKKRPSVIALNKLMKDRRESLIEEVHGARRSSGTPPAVPKKSALRPQVKSPEQTKIARGIPPPPSRKPSLPAIPQKSGLRPPVKPRSFPLKPQTKGLSSPSPSNSLPPTQFKSFQATGAATNTEIGKKTVKSKSSAGLTDDPAAIAARKLARERAMKHREKEDEKKKQR